MDIFATTITKSPEETARLGEELGNVVRKKENGKRKKGSGWSGATTVCLYGDLGSGKTTFVQGFGKALGIGARLLSPTFFIVRRYSIPQSIGYLYHIDLYRITGEKELTHLGIPEILADPDSIVLFEWAEKLTEPPSNRIDIWFTVDEEEHHHITMKGYRDQALSFQA